MIKIKTYLVAEEGEKGPSAGSEDQHWPQPGPGRFS